MEIRALLFDVNGTLIDIETDEWTTLASAWRGPLYRARQESGRQARVRERL